MRPNQFTKTRHLISGLLAGVTMMAAGAALAADVTVNLTAQRTSTTLPDGNTVPMWAYCGSSTCATWTPGPTITAAPGDNLTINLTNNLAEATSVVILGQFGGGIGSPNKEASPAHGTQQLSWPAVGNSANGDPTFTPPTQGMRARSFAPEAGANGGTQTYTWNGLKAGTYLYATGTHPSLQQPMGLYGVLIVTDTSATPAKAYPSVSYDADTTLLLSEIDPKMNALTDAAMGDASKYPQAVNYTPLYFLVNGRAFDPTQVSAGALPIPATATSGNVLMRFVNAGLRSHTPATMGLPMLQAAEDGNVRPGRQTFSNLLVPAGKTMDVIVKPAITGTTLPSTYKPAAYGIMDRQLGLSNNNQSVGGMQAILNVGGVDLSTLGASCAANADTFAVAFGKSTFTGNVLANDRGITGVTTTDAKVTLDPVSGAFTYTGLPASGTVSFTYNGTCVATTAAVTATVTLNVTGQGGAPSVTDKSYTATNASKLTVKVPGLLEGATDPNNYKLTAQIGTNNNAGVLTVSVNTDGSFTASATAPGTYSFTYTALNAQGTASPAMTAKVIFPAGSGLQVSVVDAMTKASISDGDYSWVIEEDKTFFHDPKNPSESDINKIIATNFHRSYMPLVAAGCTGPRSCGATNAGTGEPIPTPSFPQNVVLDPNKRYYISILPGDAITNADGTGHSIGGAGFTGTSSAVTVLCPPSPLPGAQLSVFVFEDKGPTNGSPDEGEPGLGGFTIQLVDTRGSSGDPAGQMTYDLAAMPLNNSLAGTIDTVTGANLCPIPLPIGMITTCPELDSQGNPSRFAGMALIRDIPPGRYDVIAIPGSARTVKGENWIQVSTLEGAPVQDAFIKAGEPAYWQEFGPAGLHAVVGFINVDHVAAANAEQAALGAQNTIRGNISSLHMDRPPGATLNDSCANPGVVDATCRASLSFTQCYVSVNMNTDGNNVAFAQCDQDGNFELKNVPDGSHELVIWDQWLDQIIAKKAVTVDHTIKTTWEVGSIPVFSWFTRLEQGAFQDLNGNGIWDDGEPGLPMVMLNLRFRDGTISNYLATDLVGSGGSNEVFPLFNWYVAETDMTRYKNTGVHVVYDSGGVPDKTGPYAGVLNSTESVPLPPALQYPGTLYTAGSTSRVDPPSVTSEGVQSFINQTSVIEWGKKPFQPGENGGISGMVFYASTRAFDRPDLEAQLAWNPGVPNVKINLYAKTVNADGTESLSLIDTAMTSSWDDNTKNMHCPGDPATDPFVTTTLKGDQFRCYDGQHVFNQVQPAVYDGRYRFPSDSYSAAHPAGLPAGLYVVEVVLPEGYEIVKEEDKNVLNGDPWTTVGGSQFAGVGNVYILTTDLAAVNDPVVPGSGAAFPPCVGRMHTVPAYLSLFPESGLFSPYAGQDRPLCDRKEVQLDDQSSGGADFPVFTMAPIAAHVTGMMLNDAAAEFNKFAPSFGEKAALPNAPVSIRDYNGIEIVRTYSDKYGNFNYLAPSTWNANIPNPSGYAPNMLTSCMNDPGPIPDGAGGLMVDPLYNPNFSNFCYNWPYMPGNTTYLDTPVLPVAAFANANAYNPVDCAYPDTTPAIKRVDGDGIGPWVAAAGGTHKLTIKALGTVLVPNPAYEGPTVNAGLGQQPKIERHYGFGSTAGTVSVGGVALTNVVWTDDTITANVPTGVATGQLEIFAANGKAAIDTVTVTVGGPAPKIVMPDNGSLTPDADGLTHPIQDAINAAQPGDLIILEAGQYPELVIMDRAVRLQGVGAASVVINAAKYPNQKIQNWRKRINTMFGLDDQGNQTLPILVDVLPGQTVAGVTLLEPSALGTEEGAGITVLARGVKADGVTPLNSSAGNNGDCNAASPNRLRNFLCGASSIDGVSVTGSDAGGGIYVNGWAHNLQIGNNRVFGNAGQFNGGIRIGQFGLDNLMPGIDPTTGTGTVGRYGFNKNVNIHHNAVTMNGTVEGAPGVINGPNTGGAGGGITLCAGSDSYTVTKNWVCGNYSSADGGGIGHIGMSRDATISKNWILFNESWNQTGTQNGGGLVIEGETDGALSIGAGTVTVDANLIQGNSAKAGHGGGVRLQNINGEEQQYNGANWTVTLTNNMIVNNVAGWSGGGLSMADVMQYSVVANNTIVSNDSMGIAGNLMNTMVNNVQTGPATSVPNPAGVSSEITSSLLINAMANNRRNNNYIANPAFTDNVIWQNRSFYFDMRNGQAMLVPSNDWNDAVAHSGTPLANQTSTGQCVAGAKYWDLGVVGNTNPTMVANVGTQVRHLNPTYTVLTAANGYTGTGNKYAQNPVLVKQYCNGGRADPGLQFEPGVPFVPDFQIAAAATLDEGGNFVDMQFGPLSLTDPGTVLVPAGTTPVMNGNYHLAATTSSAYNAGNATNASNHDFDGQARPANGAYDIGADELGLVSTTSLPFGNEQITTTSGPRRVTVTNSTNNAMTVTVSALGGTNPTNFAQTNGCGGSLPAGASCTVSVTFTPSATGARSATFTVAAAGLPTQTVSLSGTGVATYARANPTAYSFGDVSVGATATRNVVVTNNTTGTRTLSKPVSGPFSVIATGTTCGNTLAVGASCTMTVQYLPTAATTSSATLVFGSNWPTGGTNPNGGNNPSTVFTGYGQ